MEEFTPTTDDVRKTYAFAMSELHGYDFFDRWLAEHDSDVIEKLAVLIKRLTGNDRFVNTEGPYSKGWAECADYVMQILEGEFNA